MDLPCPPLDRYRIRLRLTAPTRFRFLHGGVLRGLISAALERHKLPPGIIPFAPESGRVTFAAGDAYHLGVTLVGDERRLGGQLLAGLERLGAQAPSVSPPLTLGGNFEVESIEPLQPVDLGAEVDSLASQSEVTTDFLSPLRLKRPDELIEPGAAYLNGDCFPGGHFLERLWSRLFLLTRGRYPELSERRGAASAASGIKAIPADMPWLDLPITGPRSKDHSYTLGGVLGRVTWPNLPDAWLPILATGRHLHAGASTAYGLGRYRLSTEPTPEPFVPAHPFTAVSDRHLETALDVYLEDSSLAFQLGLSRQGSDRGERKALRAGFRWRQPADLARLLRLVDPCLVQGRLQALLPLHPTRIGCDAPSQLPTLPFLVLPEIAATLPGQRLLRMPGGFFILSRRRLQLTTCASGPVLSAGVYAARNQEVAH